MANTHSTDLEAGSSQYWSIADVDQTGLNISGDFTVELWFKPETLVGAQILIIKGSDDDLEVNYRIHTGGTNGKDVNFFRGTNTGNYAFETTSEPLEDGVWTHIAVVGDISSGGIIYINGVSDATDSNTGSTHDTNTDPLVIGARFRPSAQLFADGLIDDVRIWNDVRTQTEINDNKDNCDLSTSEAGLVSWWKFDNDGTDSTTSGNDLTNNNSAIFSTDTPYTCVTFIPRITMT